MSHLACGGMENAAVGPDETGHWPFAHGVRTTVLASAQRFCATFSLVARYRHETKAFLWPRIFVAVCRESSHDSTAQVHSSIALPSSILLAA
jgi:hypothetical protein